MATIASTRPNLKAQRTKAVAPRSLFGTVIEVANEEDVRQAELLPVPQRPSKPDKLAPFLPKGAADRMKSEQDEVARQIHNARFAQNNLKEAADLALNFHPNPDTIQTGIPKGALTYKRKSHYAPYKHDIKLHSRDIALADHFNKLGLDTNPDYNYERYRRPYTHGSYRQAGTVLGRGGSFKQRDDPHMLRQSFPPTRRRVPNIRSTPGVQDGHKAFPTDPIPPNIRSLHGEELCQDVIKNEEIWVPRGPSSQAKRIPGPLIMSKFPTMVKPVVSVEPDPMYKALGTSLKQDIFNGVSHNHTKSLYNSSFTQDIHDRTVQPFPPTHAILKNQDSKWNEDVVIRQRIFKAWDAMVLLKQQEKAGSSS